MFKDIGKKARKGADLLGTGAIAVGAVDTIASFFGVGSASRGAALMVTGIGLKIASIPIAEMFGGFEAVRARVIEEYKRLLPPEKHEEVTEEDITKATHQILARHKKHIQGIVQPDGKKLIESDEWRDAAAVDYDRLNTLLWETDPQWCAKVKLPRFDEPTLLEAPPAKQDGEEEEVGTLAKQAAE